jgi:hypothetical protein
LICGNLSAEQYRLLHAVYETYIARAVLVAFHASQ